MRRSFDARFLVLPLSWLALGAASPVVTSDDVDAVFKAAGFKQGGGEWRRCEEETPMASSTPGRATFQDLNGDGKPEAIVTESSLFCYGNVEGLVVVLTKGADGSWRKILDDTGVHLVKDGKHDGWFDIEVGGPGLQVQPVYHWNGKTYVKSK